MKRNLKVIILGITIFLSSCNEEKGRIEFMENELNLIMPEEYEQLKNSTDGLNDFEVDIELKFTQSNLNFISNQIHDSKYYNMSKMDSIPYSIQHDTIVPGMWIKSKIGFEFIRIGNQFEPIQASIDTSKRILKFNFIHL